MIFPKSFDSVHIHLERLARTQLYEDGLRDGGCRWMRREKLCLFALRCPLQMLRAYFWVVVKDSGICAISWRGGITAVSS